MTYVNLFKTALKVIGLFLDISKVFNNIWHEALIYKRKQNGTSGKLLSMVKGILDSIKQRVVLNWQSSSWASIAKGLPPNSILGSSFSLNYINVLLKELSSNSKLFSDGTTLLRCS